MGNLYSRKDYEMELAVIDAISTELTRKLLRGEVDPWTVRQANFKVQHLKDEAKKKLDRTRYILSLNRKERLQGDKRTQDGGVMTVRRGPDGELERRGIGGEWKPATKKEVVDAARLGKVMVVEGK